MSDLIDRYVMAVAANLSKADREDVPAELRDILYSKVEAKEAELGRPLKRAEEEKLLRDYGHPLVVAASYGRYQTVIGPTVYPFYIFTLKVVGGILIAIFLVKLVVAAVAGAPSISPDADLVPVLFTAGGIITLVYALIERFGKPERLAAKWQVGHLPHLGAPAGRRPFEIMFELAAIAAAILWWVGLLHIPDAAPGFIQLELGPVWDTLHWPILGFFVLQFITGLFELIAPGLARAHALMRIGYHLLGLVFVAVLWRAEHWIDVTVTLPDRPDLAQRLNENFNHGFKIGLTVAVFIILFEIGRSALRLIRYRRLTRAQAA
jgi:hypothetical protein